MSDESEVDRVLAQYGPGTAPYVHDPEDLHSLGIISSMNPTYAPGPRASGNVEDRSQTDPSSHVWSPYFRSQFWGMSTPPPQPHPSSQWQPDAIANERDFVAMPRADGGEVLAQYGQGYTAPQLNSGDGEIASTPDIMAQYGANERMSSGLPGFLRRIGQGLRGLAPSQVSTPVKTLTGREPNLRGREDHANPLMLMGGEGADTMASWMDAHPGVDRGQSRPQDLLAPLGLSAMAPLTAVNNAAGIFGGRLARTADREALSRAEEMAGRGASRDDIWNQTGWFQGRDGQWRFEIDDAGLRVREGDGFDTIRHPEMRRGYPDRILSNVEHDDYVMGGYEPIGGRDRRGEFSSIDVAGPNSSSQRSTAAHELQHHVQHQEGFPTGGNPYQFGWWDVLRERMRTLEPSSDAAREGLYRRVAGETEARNVQTRLDMSPTERRARPPWETQDVPDADQILRQYSAGPQMSVPDTKGWFSGLLGRRTPNEQPAMPAPGNPLVGLESAVRLGDKTFSGETHYHALENARRALGDDTFERALATAQEGWTHQGRFISDPNDLTRLMHPEWFTDAPTKGGGGRPQSPIGPAADEVLRQYSQGPQMSAPTSRFDLTPSPQMRTVEVGPTEFNYRVRDNGIHLSSVNVDPELRGQGHGRAAMQEFLREADAAGRPVSLQIQGESAAAERQLARFYRSLGFRDEGGVWRRPVGRP